MIFIIEDLTLSVTGGAVSSCVFQVFFIKFHHIQKRIQFFLNSFYIKRWKNSILKKINNRFDGIRTHEATKAIGPKPISFDHSDTNLKKSFKKKY